MLSLKKYFSLFLSDHTNNCSDLILLTPLSNDRNNWDEFVNLYVTAFPSDERREISELINIQGIENYSLLQITFNEKFIGFLELWEFKKFLFLEHLAILSEEQQKGYGTEVLKSILLSSVRPVILEAEPPADTLSAKRIHFYQRAGFNILNFDYTQPPYYPGKNAVPMLLLSNKDLSEKITAEYVIEIRNEVYKIY